MAHTRIRTFNTADTYPEQNLDNDLCQVVRAGDTVYLRGQVGQDLESGESVGLGDPAAQAEQAMRNVEQLLTEAGASLDDDLHDVGLAPSERPEEARALAVVDLLAGIERRLVPAVLHGDAETDD